MKKGNHFGFWTQYHEYGSKTKIYHQILKPEVIVHSSPGVYAMAAAIMSCYGMGITPVIGNASSVFTPFTLSLNQP